MKLKVSVIILNYFGENIIGETLDSLIKIDFPKQNFEIIVTDNNSTDNSRQIINDYVKKYPNLIKTIYLSKNLGFAGGNNCAIRIAKGEYIILLNNDCIVDKNWLKELVKLADTDQKIFSISSKLLRYPNALNEIQNAGSMVFQDGYGRDIGAIITLDHQQLYEKDQKQFSGNRQVYSSCGAAVLYRKSILDKIGLLDEKFFMYYEDTELSERANLAGYKNFYCDNAFVYHHHSASSKEWSPFFIYHVEKGRLMHLLFHFPLKIYFKEYYKFTFKSLFRFAYGLRHPKEFKRGWSYLKVSFSFINNFPSYFKHRQSFSKIYNPEKRLENYHKILSGYWYFN